MTDDKKIIDAEYKEVKPFNLFETISILVMAFSLMLLFALIRDYVTPALRAYFGG